MLAVVKTPSIKIQIKGKIPSKLITLLKDEYGRKVKLIDDDIEEKIDVFDTEWYKNIKKKLSPGQNVKIYRKNNKMTQTELGKLLGGIPKQHISNMENETRPISKNIAIKLSQIFHVSVEKFIG
jgi:DNA-binding XRE family transcriptional regulator